MTEISLVVLAAGMGSRYGGLKQMEPVGPNGELLIEYSIYDALAAGIRRLVFVIQKDQESSFRDLLAEKLEDRCDVSYVHQELSDLPPGAILPPERDKPWGTGHAVLSCRDVVCGPFAVVNADDFYGRDSYAQLAGFLGSTSDSSDEVALVGFDLKKTLTTHGTVSRGVCSVDENGFLVKIDERTKVGWREDLLVYWDGDGNPHELPGDSVASMNMWAFPKHFMRELAGKFAEFLKATSTDPVRDEFFLPGAVGDLMAESCTRVRVLPTAEEWMGVTYREDIPRVREGIRVLIEGGIFPDKLWEDAP